MPVRNVASTGSNRARRASGVEDPFDVVLVSCLLVRSGRCAAAVRSVVHGVGRVVARPSGDTFRGQDPNDVGW